MMHVSWCILNISDSYYLVQFVDETSEMQKEQMLYSVDFLIDYCQPEGPYNTVFVQLWM